MGSVRNVGVGPYGCEVYGVPKIGRMKVLELGERESAREDGKSHANRVNAYQSRLDGRQQVRDLDGWTLQMWDLESGLRAGHLGGPLELGPRVRGEGERAARVVGLGRSDAEGVGSRERALARDPGRPRSGGERMRRRRGRPAPGLGVARRDPEGLGPRDLRLPAHATR